MELFFDILFTSISSKVDSKIDLINDKTIRIGIRIVFVVLLFICIMGLGLFFLIHEL